MLTDRQITLNNTKRELEKENLKLRHTYWQNEEAISILTLDNDRIKIRRDEIEKEVSVINEELGFKTVIDISAIGVD